MILILQVLALVCFIAAALGVSAPKSHPIGWGWVGLFLWLLSLMLGGVDLHTAH